MTFYDRTLTRGRVLVLSLSFVGIAAAKDKPEVTATKAKYTQRYAEVLQTGMIAGYCKGLMYLGRPIIDPGIALEMSETGIKKIENPAQCPTQELPKGEAIFIDRVVTGGKMIVLSVDRVPRAVTRGVGAFQHESVETGRVGLGFRLDGDFNSEISHWLKLTDTPDHDKVSNTAGLAVVKQVKLGMSAAEVEQALGLPQARIDLDSKVLYKYKDMTVEFHDGKVTDVR